MHCIGMDVVSGQLGKYIYLLSTALLVKPEQLFHPAEHEQGGWESLEVNLCNNMHGNKPHCGT